MVEMTIGQDAEPFAYDRLKDEGVLGIWSHEVTGGLSVIRLLVVGRQVEPVMDMLTEKYGELKEFRTVVLPVEASLPRFRTAGGMVSDEQGHVYEPDRDDKPDRMSREELYVTVGDAAKPGTSFVALVVLSAIVAAIGVLRDNMAIVIGAMVIAPLLGPSIALALGTALGDRELIRRSLKSNVIGIGLSYLLAVAVGLVLRYADVSWTPDVRSSVAFTDVALALASGTAGALAFTSRLSTALVGVMVAVALLPPLVTSGLLMGTGRYAAAPAVSLLFLTNLICVNLSAVLTFLAQGIRPATDDRARRANVAVTAAVIMWIVFLIGLVTFLIYRQPVHFLKI